MPHSLIGPQIRYCSLNIAKCEANRAPKKSARFLNFGEEALPLGDEAREPCPMLAQVGGRWVLEDHSLILRVPKQPNGLEPRDQVMNQTIPASEMIFRIQVHHQA